MAIDRPPLRIGNASGFYGDRFSAVREMLEHWAEHDLNHLGQIRSTLAG